MGYFLTRNLCARNSYHDVTMPDGTVIVYSIYSDMTSPDSDIKITYSNPEWRIQIAKRQEAGRAYTLIKNEYQLKQGKCTSIGLKDYKGRKAFSKFTDVGDLPSWSNGQSAALRDQALTKLKRKLKKRVGDANAMVPIAESRELQGLVRTAVKMTTSMMDTLIDIKRTKGMSALKYASDAWLGFNFGIAPLVADTKKISEAIGNYLDRGDSAFRETATSTADWVTSYYHGDRSSGWNGGHVHGYSRHEHKLSYRYYCGGVITIRSSEDYGLTSHLGLGVGELIPTLWELVPYSWVVDYFTTVGAFLDDTFWVLPGSVTYAGYTRRYECRIVTDWVWKNSDPAYWAIQPTNGQSIIKRFEFERVPIASTLSTIGLRIRSFDQVGNYGVTKLLNLASVLLQRR